MLVEDEQGKGRAEQPVLLRYLPARFTDERTRRQPGGGSPARHCGTLMSSPAAFAGLLERLLHDRAPTMAVELQLADGRVLELDFVPIYLFPAMPQPRIAAGISGCSARSPSANEAEVEIRRAREGCRAGEQCEERLPRQHEP